MKTTQPKFFLLDVDGVFTTGQFLYTKSGKYAKVFGPHDNDGIKMIRDLIEIEAISADHKGFLITQKRMDDMKIKLTLVKEEQRLEWLKKHFDLKKTIYMGDGIFDSKIFKYVAYSIAPNSAFYLAKKKASYVTHTRAGEGAVAEACIHILNKFFIGK